MAKGRGPVGQTAMSSDAEATHWCQGDMSSSDSDARAGGSRQGPDRAASTKEPAAAFVTEWQLSVATA